MVTSQWNEDPAFGWGVLVYVPSNGHVSADTSPRYKSRKVQPMLCGRHKNCLWMPRMSAIGF